MKLSFLRLRVLYLLVAISISALGTSSSWGQSCLCNGDVNNSGMANVVDLTIILDCVAGTCSQCVNDCDVDCDGDRDYVDFGAVLCRAQARANCCGEPTGACVGATSFLPPCAVTTQAACEDQIVGGTYIGNGSFCNGNQAVPVPAASAWGLAALTLSLLTVGSLLLRPRRANANSLAGACGIHTGSQAASGTR